MWGSEIRLWFVCFLCKTLPKRLKFNEIDIYMSKVQKKSIRTRSEICSKLTIKTPKRRTLKLFYFTPSSSFSMLTLGICCIHFHINRSSHLEVFFKKGFLHLASLQENIHAELWVNSTEILLLYGYSSKNKKHICSRTPFLENTSGELILYTVFNIEVINVEVLHKQVKYLV